MLDSSIKCKCSHRHRAQRGVEAQKQAAVRQSNTGTHAMVAKLRLLEQASKGTFCGYRLVHTGRCLSLAGLHRLSGLPETSRKPAGKF